jgi:hypothetical protein
VVLVTTPVVCAAARLGAIVVSLTNAFSSRLYGDRRLQVPRTKVDIAAEMPLPKRRQDFDPAVRRLAPLLPLPGCLRVERRRTARARRAALAVLALGVLTAAPARAAFSLGAFEAYGLLINSGIRSGDIQAAGAGSNQVNANIGIGDVTNRVDLHSGIVNGVVDVKGSASTELSNYTKISGTQAPGLGGAAAAVNSNVADVAKAITDAKNLASTYGSTLALDTAKDLTDGIGGSQTLLASSGNAYGGAQLFKTTTFNIGWGNTLTISGGAADYVVIDVTGNINYALNGAIALTGGITADQVLINFTGTITSDKLTGGRDSSHAAGILNATILAQNFTINLDNLLIAGHLFGGGAGTNYTFGNNAQIVQPDYTTPARTPEPASLALASLALGAMVIARRGRNIG